jgi:hypothetical protein
MGSGEKVGEGTAPGLGETEIFGPAAGLASLRDKVFSSTQPLAVSKRITGTEIWLIVLFKIVPDQMNSVGKDSLRMLWPRYGA